MLKNSKHEDLYYLVVIFLFAVVTKIYFSLELFHGLYSQTKDGDLYLSIARNFWETGHFIQNARPYEVDMVVPFGLPLIYTIIWGMFRSIIPIIILQYAVFGICGILIYKIIKYLCNYKIIALMGAISFYIVDNVVISINPSSLLTETWVVFLSILFVYYLLTQKERITTRLIIAFALCVIRPVCFPFLMIAILEIVVNIYEKGVNYNRKSILCGIILCLILGVNIFVNYKETGEIVVLQNYAGLAVYQANNPSTELDEYNSKRAYEFVDEDDRFWDIYNGNYTTSEKSAQWSEMAKEYISNNLLRVILNTKEKFIYMFFTFYKPYGLIAVLFWSYYSIFINRKRGMLMVMPYAIIALSTSMGLVIHRYSVFIIPMYVIGCWVLIGYIFKFIFKEYSR